MTESTYRYLKVTKNNVESVEEDGLFEIILNEINDSGKEIIKEFINIVKEIEEQYPLYIRSDFNEEIG